MADLLDQAGTASPGGLPFGWHDVIVRESVYEPASTGSAMIKVLLEAVNGASQGGTQYDRLVLTPKAAKFFFQKVMALGIEREHLATIPDDFNDEASLHAAAETIAGWLEGRYASIEVGPQKKGEYKGSPEVVQYKPYGQGGPAAGAPPAAAPAPAPAPAAPPAAPPPAAPADTGSAGAPAPAPPPPAPQPPPAAPPF